ncbi:MAG: phosphopentomutase, partial [Clostridia bacterium]|nr:phosphopentomutase [Clostridia bacterium]
MAKRVFLIVLDSCGIGEMPDAADFGDKGANTLKSISKSEYFSISTMKELGYFNIDGVDYLQGVDCPAGAYGKIAERSKG